MKLNGIIRIIFANLLGLWRREKISAITQGSRKKRGDLRQVVDWGSCQAMGNGAERGGGHDVHCGSERTALGQLGG